MNSENRTLENLNERDLLLVNAYVDTELNGAELIKFEQRLKDGDAQLIKAIEEVRLLREQFVFWHEEKLKSAKHDLTHDKDRMWQKIETEIRRREASGSNWVTRLSKNIAKLSSGKAFRQIALPSAAVLIFFFVSGGELTNNLNKSAISSTSESNVVQFGHSSGIDVAPIRFAHQSSDNLTSRQLGNMNFLKSRRLTDPELAHINSERRGMLLYKTLQEKQKLANQPIVINRWRTRGVDVEWLRSEKPVRIIQAKDTDMPAVIWVAGTGR